MKFNTEIETDVIKLKDYFNKLLSQKGIIELKKVRKVRSLSQNAYLHVCITLYAINFGSTLNEAKTDLKRMCPFMVYEKNSKKYLKETHKLDSKEMTNFIDWIRNHSSQQGCYIPSANEYLLNKSGIDNEMENYRQYL